jgi:thiol:disulfide interchange protein
VPVVEFDVTASQDVRDRMLREFGRVATPAIVIGERVFWGFDENRRDIADRLGVAAGDDEGS